MKILFIILIPIVFMAIMGGAIFFVFKKYNVLGAPDIQESKANTLQQFIPLERIDGSYLVMKDGKIANVIECSSTNYNHLSGEEQNSMELLYHSFINSLNFPFVTFIQSRIIDNTLRCRYIRENIDEVEEDFPGLSEYAEKYYAAMEDITSYIGNSRQKKKFIILPYNETVEVEGLTKEEKEVYIKKELQRRCDTVISGLAGLQIKAFVLNEKGLNDLVYSTFHRDGYGYADNITTKEAMSIFVDGAKSGLNGINAKEKIFVDLNKVINSMRSFKEEIDIDEKDIATLKAIEEKYF